MLENIPYHFHENTYIYFVVTHWPILNDTFNLLSLPSWLASILNSLPKNYNKTNKSLVLRYKNYYCMFNVWKLSLMAYYFEKKKDKKKKTKATWSFIAELKIWVQSWEEGKNGPHLLHSLSSLYPDITCCLVYIQ